MCRQGLPILTPQVYAMKYGYFIGVGNNIIMSILQILSVAQQQSHGLVYNMPTRTCKPLHELNSKINNGWLVHNKIKYKNSS